ncbi:MAG: isochorismatase family protein [Candidatus Lokiarchaeota archaeon]|nr:isochorismatase family protein [Candidatus Lokiarchaeota archaeon]
MSKQNKKLNIIITCSFQNDFIESLDDLKQSNDKLKMDYLKSQEMWIKYFNDKDVDTSQATVEQFISWLKESTESQDDDIILSYHKILEKYKHRVHIDYDESKRLWQGGNLKKFLKDLMVKGSKALNDDNSPEEYQCIHLRDWHDQTDILQKGELDNFGLHCMKGTYGAKFISPLDELIKKHHEFNIIINSNSLSSFAETELESVLNTIINNSGSSKNEVNIGIFGVITNVKIFLLAFELMVIHNFRNVSVCGDFCAGFTNQGHFEGINSMANILVANVANHDEFRKIFNIKK